MNFHGASQRKHTTKTILIVVVSVVFVGVVAAAGYFFWQYTQLKSNPEAVNEQRTMALVEKVGLLYALPDEKPTVAEISDKDKLKEQLFFKNAENGDKLLIFPNAKQALIYRESTNKLINVGPISLSAEEDAASVTE
jgi:uncharacterized membrane protein YvbJ